MPMHGRKKVSMIPKEKLKQFYLDLQRIVVKIQKEVKNE